MADLDQYNLIIYFSKKMILVETKYKTHHLKFLTIIRAFETWQYYLKSYKREFFILINYNNLY